MKKTALLALLLAHLLPAGARPSVAPGDYTPFQPGKSRPESIRFNSRMVTLQFPKTSWEVPVEAVRPGLLVLDPNPNLAPGRAPWESLRFAPGPWPGTAWFSLQSARGPWKLQEVYLSAATRERWGQLPTAPFSDRDQAVALMREYYAWALTRPDPESDFNLPTWLLKKGYNPVASMAALATQEMTLSTEPEFMKILQDYYSRLKRQRR